MPPITREAQVYLINNYIYLKINTFSVRFIAYQYGIVCLYAVVQIVGNSVLRHGLR